MKLLFSLVIAFGLAGCKPSERTPHPQETGAARVAAPSMSQRFVPSGNDPEIALDTQKGSLCRTTAPMAKSNPKYATLPMCAPAEAVLAVQPVTSFAWQMALKDAPLEVSCSEGKNLVPMYSASGPASMDVTPGCIIENRTASDQPLVGNITYDAIFRRPNGEMFKRLRVSLASSENVVPAHGRVEGGLWIKADCSTNESPSACLKGWLAGAEELVLVSESADARAYVRMDRDKDPLGILK